MKMGLGGAGVLAAMYLLPKIIGKKDQGLPPEMQLMAMRQMMAQQKGGGGDEEGKSMSRELLNLTRIMTLKKMMEDMGGMQQQMQPSPMRIV